MRPKRRNSRSPSSPDTAATENEVPGTTGLPIATVTVAPLLGSVLLSLVTIILVGTIASLVVLDQFQPKTAALLAGILAVYLLGFAGIIWRRLSGQYNFTAVEGPDGVHIQRGLLQTISETIPYGRIQAIRQVEPLLWRPFGWCRLEVDIAGATRRNQRSEGTAVVRKALLPVGSQQDSWHLIARLLGGPDPVRTPPPRRARLKAPLSYHFLSAGHDDTHAVCVTGRINRATTWVPFEKSQSIRRVQGPLQRPLGLATVHVDVAGRRTRAEFRDRTVEEADVLVDAADRPQPTGAASRPSANAHTIVARRRSLGLVPGSFRPPRAALLARRPLDRACRRRGSPDDGGAYDGTVKRIGKWSMERMPAVYSSV